jgi:hypothetical protein
MAEELMSGHKYVSTTLACVGVLSLKLRVPPPLLCVCTNKPTHFETGGRPANPLSTWARLLVTLPACVRATPTTAETHVQVRGMMGVCFVFYVTAWLVNISLACGGGLNLKLRVPQPLLCVRTNKHTHFETGERQVISTWASL